MSGLISFLIASTIFASVGTVVRGLLRPISWALLALALALLISNRLTGIPAAGGEDVVNQTTSTPIPASPSAQPVAQEGWQDVARELESVYSDTLADAQDPAAARSGAGTSADSTAAPQRRAANSNTRQNSSPAASQQSPSPIPGFW